MRLTSLKATHWLAIGAVLSATALVYLVGLSGPLVFDDFHNLAPIGDWLKGSRDWTWVLFNNSSGMLGRPISMGSLMLGAWLFGPEVSVIKAGNLLLHLANGVLVFFLLLAFTRRQTGAKISWSGRPWLAWSGAAIWLLHPLLVSTVLYSIQRMAILSTFFMLLALVAFAYERHSSQLRWQRAGLITVFTILAVFSKENGILVVPLCAVLELFLFVPIKGTKRTTTSKAIIMIGLVLPALTAISLVIFKADVVFAGYENRPFTLTERLLTQPRVLWDYVESIVAPFGPRLGLFHDDYIVSTSLLSPQTTVIAVVAWLAVCVTAWRTRALIPGFSLGVGIFLVSHALESTIFPLLMYFEHRNYLASLGVIWAILSLFDFLISANAQRMNRQNLLRCFAAISIPLVLGAATWARAGVWATQDAILAQGLKYHPDSRWMRMDSIRSAVSKSPPDFATARRHIEFMEKADSEPTRRIGAMWGLIWSCLQKQPPKQGDISMAFGGQATTLEADALIMYESWGTLTRIDGCRGVTNSDAAKYLDHLADHAQLPSDATSVRRLRYKSAELFMTAGQYAAAMEQAELAYTGAVYDAPIGGLIVRLDIARGNLERARTLLAKLRKQVPANDIPNRQMLIALDAYLRDAEDTSDE